tara:strand:+ start:363 stop:722 length:360 start_codon:yes stop_codon:yes gene_type:complete
MGFLKTNANNLVSCDNVVEVGATIGSTNLTVNIVYGTFAQGSDKLMRTELVYTSGASNEMELTAAEYQKIFADAVTSMSGATGSAVALPIVNNKVTATGAVVGALTPAYALKLTAAALT